MLEPQRIPTADVSSQELVAALHVRGHVQRVRADGQAPHLAAALAALNRSHLGDDVGDLYQRLLEAIVAAEHVATRLLVSHPDLKPRPSA